MAQPQMARITCRECNAWWNSERELRDHIQMAHRRGCPEQELPLSPVQTNGAKQGGTTSFLAEQENEMDKLYGRTPADQQEEYTRPDEEAEVGAKPD
jgi:hypothetical protein